MAKSPMEDDQFAALLAAVTQETSSDKKKIDLVYWSKGHFSALQAARLLNAYGGPSDKLQVLNILENRLCTMTCIEARHVIEAVSIHNDRLRALHAIKRYLKDCESREGVEYILSCFIYEGDKFKALQILRTVRSDVFDLVAAGGHQGYAALGGLYTQARPLLPHMYGGLDQQRQAMPGGGDIEIPVHARAPTHYSDVTSHPSYLPSAGLDYRQDRGYPGCASFDALYSGGGGECPAKEDLPVTYPAGAPRLGQHQGTPAPTGFVGVN